MEKVVIKDFSNFQSGKHINGGCYSYTEKYYRIPNTQEFEVEYSTSSEFDYCKTYGVFQSCHNCSIYDKQEKLCLDIKTITDDELKEIIKDIENNEDIDIIIEY